jgi:preprotein translocase subunit Sec61beta
MSLDHFVPQVHLRNFYSPNLRGLMYAIRKSDLKLFTPDAKSVCRIEDGSTNSYLREDRIVEEFLKRIEPRYNAALEKLMADKIDPECIFVIAGFVAYVYSCSPAGMRVNLEPLKTIVEDMARILESKGSLPPPPPVLGGKSLTELLQSGDIQISIDPKYPQAIGIASILLVTITFGNFEWDVLINPFEKGPFFTSDFPIAIERTHDARILNKIIPLAPHIAIRIRPILSYDRKHPDYSFSGFRRNIRKLSRSEVMNINRLIVRCAETTVFFRDNYEWVSSFVKKNANFRIEMRTVKIPYEKGDLLWTTQEIRKVI